MFMALLAWNSNDSRKAHCESWGYTALVAQDHARERQNQGAERPKVITATASKS